MNKVGDSETWREIKTSHAATKRFYKGGSLTFYRMETIGYLFFWIAGIATFIVGLSGNWLLSILAGLLLFLCWKSLNRSMTYISTFTGCSTGKKILQIMWHEIICQCANWHIIIQIEYFLPDGFWLSGRKAQASLT